MGVSNRYILQQGPVISTLARVALQAAKKDSLAPGAAKFKVPGRLLKRTLAPLPADLVRDYVRHVGGDPASYRGLLPAHLFPQWLFPLQAEGLEGIPYPMHKVMNGGCRLELNGPLPLNKPLKVTARLEDIDDNGRRAVLHTRCTTGPKENPEALVAHVYAIVPTPKTDSTKKKAKKPRAKAKAKLPKRVPEAARELAYWNIGGGAGLDFAKLTGDFNPIHWVPAYARMFGFRNCILHGFSTLARAIEGLNRGLYAGDPSRLQSIDVQFTKPLVLPAKVGLYIDANKLYVGDAPGGSAYMVGTFEARKA